MRFTIEYPKLAEAGAPISYDSLEQAREALRRGLGWSDIYLGPGYTTPDGANQVWCAYPKPPAEDDDSENEHAPRITRVFEGASWRRATT